MPDIDPAIIVVAGTLVATQEVGDAPAIMTKQYSYKATSPAQAVGFFVLDVLNDNPRYSIRGAPVYTIPAQLTWPAKKPAESETPEDKPDLQVVEEDDEDQQ